MPKKILELIIKHKIIAAIVIICLALGGFFGYKAVNSTTQETRYVLSAVEKGTIISSVTGTGQVSASNQLDLKPTVSGKIINLPIVAGQEVKTGALIARIDTSDVYKNVRDAQSSLESAKLSLEKLKQAADPLTLLQAENSLTSAKESKINAEDDLVKSYEDGFNAVANAFLQLPDIISGLYDILYGGDISQSQSNSDYYSNSLNQNEAIIFTYKDTASNSYIKARSEYDKNFSGYKSASRFSETSVIESLIDQTYNTTKSIAEAIKNTNNLIQFYYDKTLEHNREPVQQATTHLSTLSNYTSIINNHISNLLAIKTSIQNAKATITSAERSITEKEESLKELKEGTDPLDIKAQELSIAQKKSALADAYDNLSDYTIYAPFDGVIASVDAKKGDTASSGTGIATLITKQSIAEISLNEIDVARVKSGQKATLTFDAAEDLSITGNVIEVDAIGTVSQGVVSYNVKISFDAEDERIKPGMSVSASIITDSRQDILVVPSSAIKNSGEISYVETLEGQTEANSQGVVSTATLKQIQVEVGLSDDTNTEIISGLNEGDIIITKTIISSSSKSSLGSSSSKNSSIFGGGMPGMR